MELNPTQVTAACLSACFPYFSGVTFNMDNIVIGNYTQDGIDLQLTVAVSYPVNSSSDPDLLVLPKQTLIGE